jgi:thiamine-monophosphate kinase
VAAAETIRGLGELGTIARIRGAVGASTAVGVRTGIGDDAAVLALAPGTLLVATTDLVLEGVHFRRAWSSSYDVGWKSMAVNLSDIAAMGGTPRWALIAVALPASTAVEELDALYSGLRDAAAPADVVIVGGDTSASPDGWMINVTLLGEHPGAPKLRSAARIHDAVVVTGTLGRSAAGLALLQTGEMTHPGLSARASLELTGAHLRPSARLAEGRWLGGQPGVHAMMDMSDGLATDLGHICRESGVGARIMLDALPVASATREAASALGKDPLEWATRGGEDYELLFTCEPGGVDSLAEGLRRIGGAAITVIGRIERAEAAVTFVDARGTPVMLGSGYQHFHG